MGNPTELLIEQARELPEPLAREVLDFIGYLEAKHAARDFRPHDYKSAQPAGRRNVWNDLEDEFWSDL